MRDLPHPPLYASLRRTGRVEIGLHALLALAHSSADRPVRLADLTAEWSASPKFLSTVLGRLSQCGFLDSSRGVHGGYWLARPLEEITVAQVVDALGPERFDGCTCTLPEGTQTFDDLWARVDDRLRAVLDDVAVSDLAPGRALDLQRTFDTKEPMGSLRIERS